MMLEDIQKSLLKADDFYTKEEQAEIKIIIMIKKIFLILNILIFNIINNNYYCNT